MSGAAGTTRSDPFDPHSPRYKCCCGSYHVKRGSLIIGIITLIGLLIHLIANLTVMFGLTGTSTKEVVEEEGIEVPERVENLNTGVFAGGVVQLCWMLFVLTSILLLILGLKKERNGFLIPFLLMLIFLGVIFLLAACGVTFLLITGSALLYGRESQAEASQPDTDGATEASEARGLRAILIVVVAAAYIFFALGFAVCIWFFFVVFRCYQYFKDKSRYQAVTTIPMSQDWAPPPYQVGHGVKPTAPPSAPPPQYHPHKVPGMY